MIALQDMGHKRLALEAGEDPRNNPIEYILESIKTIYSVHHKNGAIRRVNVNIAATTVENYRKLRDAGIGTYILFQETYNKTAYEALHPTGPKSDYAYHTEAMDRAMEGGIDDVGIGVLFGLNTYRYDFTGLLMHAEHLEARFGVGPHTISVPRICPADDIDTINTELILADLQTIENALPKLEKDLRGKKIEPAYMDAVKQAKTILEAGETLDKAAREGRFDKDSVYDLHLMTAKPFIYVFNVDDNELANKDLQAKLAASVAPAPAVFLNAQFEADLTELDEADAREMLEDAGLSESGLDQLARVGFDILGLQTFLTAGVKEVRAWQIHKGWTAPQAAGVIHTDFEKGFIKADIVSYDDFVAADGSMAKIKEEGKLRQEGRDYVMADGDIVEFKFNVSK